MRVESIALPAATFSPGASKCGRNDPCYCGSRRKFKVCCLPNQDDLDRVAVSSRRGAVENYERERAELSARKAAT